jgi:hypothetical protein
MMDRKRYPKNWDEISRRIRTRANGRCEWCGVEAGKPRDYEQKGPCIVLTVHHIGVPKPDGMPGDPHDKMDCRDENLVALCQRCHLRADLPIHMAHAKATRQRKAAERRQESGQLSMFDGHWPAVEHRDAQITKNHGAPED